MRRRRWSREHSRAVLAGFVAALAVHGAHQAHHLRLGRACSAAKGAAKGAGVASVLREARPRERARGERGGRKGRGAAFDAQLNACSCRSSAARRPPPPAMRGGRPVRRPSGSMSSAAHLGGATIPRSAEHVRSRPTFLHWFAIDRPLAIPSRSTVRLRPSSVRPSGRQMLPPQPVRAGRVVWRPTEGGKGRLRPPAVRSPPAIAVAPAHQPDRGQIAELAGTSRLLSGASPLRHPPGCCTRCRAAGVSWDGPNLRVGILGEASPAARLRWP